MEVCGKIKKLRQAHLKFGQTKKIIEDKENIPKKHDELSPADQENIDLHKDDTVFKPIERKARKLVGDNVLEVQVDVHQTIQCPEVSTSSMESDAEKSDGEIIDLTEDTKVDQNLKMSDETSRNIDAVIDYVIKQGLVNADSLFINQVASKETRKRYRSRSPCVLVDKEKLKTFAALKSSSSENTDSLGLTETNTVAIKKSRRSILDMLSVSRNASAEESKTEKTVKKCPEGNTEEPMLVEINEPLDQEKNNSIEESLLKSKPTALVDVRVELSGEVDSKGSTSALAPENMDTIDLCENEGGANATVVTPLKEKPSGSSQSSEKKVSPPSAKKSRPSRKSAEAQRLKDEKEKEREEKRKLKEEEKLSREAEKLESKRKKEEERLQREEEKRKKKEEVDKMREEKLKKKHEEIEKKKAELEAKRIEKEKKDEEKRREKEQKETEKRLKEEEKQKIMEEKAKAEEDKKRKSKKQATSFKSFFTPTKVSLPKKFSQNVVGSFVPFQLKEDMYLSPQPQSLGSEKKIVLEQQLDEQTTAPSYLKELGKSSVKRCRPRTLPKKNRGPLSLSEDGVEILSSGDAVNPSLLRPKLLQFSENVRPPYYGTWRKKSKKLSVRNPLKQDKDIFDYEMDSDEEWEDPGDGEDIANSDGEEEGDKEKDDDEDDGDGFFVPHGYLSDDEGMNGEEEEEDVAEERSDQKLKMKQQEFENSFKQKIKVLVPLAIGCVWDDTSDQFSSSRVAELQKYQVKLFVPGPIELDEKLVDDANKSDNKTPSSTKKSVPEEAIPDLIRMVHGNPHSLGRLVPEFQEFWKRKNTNETPNSSTPSVPLDSAYSSTLSSSLSNSLYTSPYSASGLSLLNRSPFWISKTQLIKKMKEIGTYARKENYSRACWLVLDQVFTKYELNQSDFPIPCKWDYVTFEPDVKLYATETPPLPVDIPSTADAVAKGNIDKFATKVPAKVLIEKSSLRILQEREKQTQQSPQLLKFATNKISPEKLLETSRQKNSLEDSKQKRRVNLITIALANDCSSSLNAEADSEVSTGSPASFGFPSHDAFKSFFKVKENAPTKSEDKETSNDNTESMDCEENPKTEMQEEKNMTERESPGQSCEKTDVDAVAADAIDDVMQQEKSDQKEKMEVSKE